jgi:hypothetical protein
LSASIIASKYCEPMPVSRMVVPGVMPVTPVEEVLRASIVR